MEKRILINLRHLFAALSVVVLAGCATSTSSQFDGPLKPITLTRAGTSKVASLEFNSDLWVRIREGFAMPDLQHELVDAQEQWYSSRPDYIERMTTRSSKYLFHIVEELELRNMPTELALLPYIESAFNPQAVSSAKAAGMWQFMPATGSYFDLTQNAFRDDRRDVLASTKAALDYLEKLHRMFGDWYLALAAYNWGEGNVGKAIKRSGLENAGYVDLTMPNETRNYVPKLQAVKNIIANPEKFNIELPVIADHPYFQAVDIDRDMDVELLARLADVRIDDFRALNPSFSRPTIFAAGTTQILLPWDNAKVFQRNLAAYNDGQYASWTVWIAPSTMTVASAAQRVGMSEADLRSLNRIPPRVMIKSGSALMVPRTAQHLDDVSSHIADTGILAFAPEVTDVTRRTSIKVRRGDSLSKIASRNGVSLADLARWNNLKTTSALKAGQSLDIYKAVKLTTKTASTTKSAPTKKARGGAVAKKSSGTAIAQKSKGGTATKKKR